MEELRTLRLTELLDNAWKSLRQHFVAIFLPFALLLTPLLVVIHVGSSMMSQKMLTGPSEDPLAVLSYMGLFFLAFIPLMLATLVVYRGMMICSLWAERGEPYSWTRAILLYLHPRFWATDLLAVILMIVGFFFCVLPGLFLMAAWSLRLPIMVQEERFGWSALSRSWELLNFNPSKELARHPLLKAVVAFLVAMVLSYSVTLLIQLPVGLWTQYMTFRDAASGNMEQLQGTLQTMLWITLPFGILAGLGQLAVNLYSDFILVGLFLDQRRRREGDDIGGRLDQLMEPPAPPTLAPEEDGWG